MPPIGYTRDEIDKIVQQHLEKFRQEGQREVRSNIERSIESISDKIEHLRQDIIKVEEN